MTIVHESLSYVKIEHPSSPKAALLSYLVIWNRAKLRKTHACFQLRVRRLLAIRIEGARLKLDSLAPIFLSMQRRNPINLRAEVRPEFHNCPKIF